MYVSVKTEVQKLFRAQGKSRRTVLDIFVYGGLAHANPRKKQIFDMLMENLIGRGVSELEFASILFDTLNIIQHIARLNAQVIAKLEGR